MWRTKVTALERTCPTPTRTRLSRSSRRSSDEAVMKGIILCAGAVLAACSGLSPPEIKFAQYGELYATKPDFARVEHEFPLVSADLAELKPENLGAYNQEQIDQIYARLTAG